MTTEILKRHNYNVQTLAQFQNAAKDLRYAIVGLECSAFRCKKTFNTVKNRYNEYSCPNCGHFFIQNNPGQPYYAPDAGTPGWVLERAYKEARQGIQGKFNTSKAVLTFQYPKDLELPTGTDLNEYLAKLLHTEEPKPEPKKAKTKKTKKTTAAPKAAVEPGMIIIDNASFSAQTTGEWVINTTTTTAPPPTPQPTNGDVPF